MARLVVEIVGVWCVFYVLWNDGYSCRYVVYMLVYVVCVFGFGLMTRDLRIIVATVSRTFLNNFVLKVVSIV